MDSELKLHDSFSRQQAAVSFAQSETGVHQIQPLSDPRWGPFVDTHPRSSVFHTVAWLEALKRTYGYQPVVYTTSPAGMNLQNGLVFCWIDSWLTGRRLVSLPFSDHCEPLVGEDTDTQILLSTFRQNLIRENLEYVEIRSMQPMEEVTSLFKSNYTYCLHQLDLRPDIGSLFKNLHKDSTQRKIRRAERENLTYQDGQSESLLDIFFGLFVSTRRRLQTPPPPKEWFRNLIECFGNALKIRVAFKNNQPIASILTLRHKKALIYKYGCSDTQFNSLGATQFLFWRSIEEAKQQGLSVLDLGRSDLENTGLITFKDRLGSKRTPLVYSRFTSSIRSKATYRGVGADWKLQAAKRVFSRLPESILLRIGSLLYKHIG